jgi:uncharacterized membrane protein
MQLVGQNPRAPMIQAAMMAHIAEHAGFAYRQRIEQQLGMALPQDGKPLSPEMEHQLAQMMAQAGQQVLQQSQQKQAQDKAAQDAQDPVIQMQQQELAQKDKELALKHLKVVGDLSAKNDEIELRQRENAAKMMLDYARLEAEQDRAGVQTGVDMAKHQAQLAVQQLTQQNKPGSEE